MCCHCCVTYFSVFAFIIFKDFLKSIQTTRFGNIVHYVSDFYHGPYEPDHRAINKAAFTGMKNYKAIKK